MTTQLISIGDELLNGDTANTNAAWLGRFLADHGFPVSRVHAVGDHAGDIRAAVDSAIRSADLVITTGGLGPTPDDLTKDALAGLFDAELTIHEPTLEFIKKMFEKRGFEFTESNRRQAEILSNSEALFNKKGTAPGMWITRGDSVLVVLPGIPAEMKELMREEVLARLQKRYPEVAGPVTRYLLAAGVTESSLSDKWLRDLEPGGEPDAGIAFLPSPQGVRIRVASSAADRDEAEERVSGVIRKIYDLAGDVVAGEGRDLTLGRAVGDLLREKGRTIACAESCTGGLLMDMLTDIPGSSDYLAGGIVAYSNEIKIDKLGVKKDTIIANGAVSRDVALQMARGVADRFDTDIGISLTGIAGPTGGTEEKPVGTVWIGYRSLDDYFAVKAQLTEDRLLNKERSAAIALEVIRRAQLNVPAMPYDLQKHSV